MHVIYARHLKCPIACICLLMLQKPVIWSSIDACILYVWPYIYAVGCVSIAPQPATIDHYIIIGWWSLDHDFIRAGNREPMFHDGLVFQYLINYSSLLPSVLPWQRWSCGSIANMASLSLKLLGFVSGIIFSFRLESPFYSYLSSVNCVCFGFSAESNKHASYEIHETCDSVTFYFMKKLLFWY